MTIRDGNGAAPAVEMRGIVKRFPGVVANNGIEFAVRRARFTRCWAGAGKSTLMNILFGLYHPDEGEIRVNGSPVRFESARCRARRAGHGPPALHAHPTLHRDRERHSRIGGSEDRARPRVGGAAGRRARRSVWV